MNTLNGFRSFYEVHPSTLASGVFLSNLAQGFQWCRIFNWDTDESSILRARELEGFECGVVFGRSSGEALIKTSTATALLRVIGGKAAAHISGPHEAIAPTLESIKTVFPDAKSRETNEVSFHLLVERAPRAELPPPAPEGEPLGRGLGELSPLHPQPPP